MYYRYIWLRTFVSHCLLYSCVTIQINIVTSFYIYFIRIILVSDFSQAKVTNGNFEMMIYGHSLCFDEIGPDQMQSSEIIEMENDCLCRRKEKKTAKFRFVMIFNESNVFGTWMFSRQFALYKMQELLGLLKSLKQMHFQKCQTTHWNGKSIIWPHAEKKKQVTIKIVQSSSN